MHRFRINLAQYEDQKHEPDSQEERISFLIDRLRNYKKGPTKEMEKIMPALWEVQKKCEEYDEKQNLPKTNYIIEIIKALEAEHFNPELRNNVEPLSKDSQYDEIDHAE